MNPKTFLLGLLQLGIAGAILILAHYGYGVMAFLMIAIPVAVVWWRAGHTVESLWQLSPVIVAGLSVVTLISLNRPPAGQAVFPVATQVVLAVGYAVWLMYLRRLRTAGKSPVGVLAVNQLLALSAVFLAAAFWHWPEVVVVVLSWLAGYVTVEWYLRGRGERAARILAATWGLVLGEVSWVLFSWQVNYILLGGYVIVPQAAIIAVGLGYCFISIHSAHADRRLSRRRLIEYVAIAGVLLAIIIAGTRWNGVS